MRPCSSKACDHGSPVAPLRPHLKQLHYFYEIRPVHEISFCEDVFFEPTMDSDCSNSDQAGDCGGFEWPSFSLGCLLQDTSAAILSALPTKHVFDALEATDTKMSVFYVCLCNFRRSLDCLCCRHVIWHYDTNVVITATSLGQQCSGLSFPRPTVLCLVSQLH